MTTANRTRAAALVLILAAVLMSGCAKPTTGGTPNAPTPPQITIANLIKAVADANVAAVKSAIAARNNGTASAQDVRTIEAASTAVAKAGLAMDAELRSADPWCDASNSGGPLGIGCQQGKLVQILQAAGLSQLNAHISPTAQAIVAGLLTVANVLSAALGGPVI